MGAQAGGLALEFEKEAGWIMLNPDTDTPGVPSYLCSIQMRWGKVTLHFSTSMYTCFLETVNPSNAWVASDGIIQLLARATPVLFARISVVVTVPLAAQNV